MALIKEKERDNTGVFGSYWRITQRNSNFDRNDDVVTIELYQSQLSREQGKNPLSESVQFIFIEGDHPIYEFDVDTLSLADVNDFTDLEKHVRYQHIKNVAIIAKAKYDENQNLPEDQQVLLSENESKALFFHDAVDLL